MRLIFPLLAIAALLPGAARAADMPAMPAPACAAVAPPPAALAGWAQRVPLTAGRHVGGDDSPAMAPGQAADVALSPIAQVGLASALGKPAAPGDTAGLISFTAPAAGIYRVAIGAAAWIDLVRGDKSLASVAHAHGPDCTGIRKMVDFQLAPGAYILQLSGTDVATLPVMIVRLP